MKKLSVSKVVSFLLAIAVGVGIGYLLSHYRRSYGLNVRSGLLVLWLLLTWVIYPAAHQLGHLLFGLLHGYRIHSVSLRLPGRPEQDRRPLSRYTLGYPLVRCLMIPPEWRGKSAPEILYRLGGVIFDLLLTMTCLICSTLIGRATVYGFLLFVSAIWGAYCVIIAGCPLPIMGNEGDLALTLVKSPELIQWLWCGCRQVYALLDGKRYREMPDGWFPSPEIATRPDIQFLWYAWRGNRLMDAGRYAEAEQLLAFAMEKDITILKRRKATLACDRVACMLLTGSSGSDVEELWKSLVADYIIATINVPSSLRTEYIYARLVSGDELRASKVLERFEACAKTYPYPIELIAEREMMQAADRLAKK